MPPSLLARHGIIKLEMIGDFFQITQENVIRALMLSCSMIEPVVERLVDENFVAENARDMP